MRFDAVLYDSFFESHAGEYRGARLFCAVLARLNRFVFPELEPNIVVRLSQCKDKPVCYYDIDIRNSSLILNGFFVVTPDLIGYDVLRRVRQQHFSLIEARLWIAAHETRHRVQHLFGVKYQNRSMLKSNPFLRCIDRSVRAPLESLFERKNFMKGLRRHYPRMPKSELKIKWREERDAEFIALLAVSVYRGCRDMKMVARALLYGARKAHAQKTADSDQKNIG